MNRVITDDMKREYLCYFKCGWTIPQAIERVGWLFNVKHSRQLIHQSVRQWVKQGLLKELPPLAKKGRKKEI